MAGAEQECNIHGVSDVISCGLAATLVFLFSSAAVATLLAVKIITV